MIARASVEILGVRYEVGSTGCSRGIKQNKFKIALNILHARRTRLPHISWEIGTGEERTIKRSECFVVFPKLKHSLVGQAGVFLVDSKLKNVALTILLFGRAEDPRLNSC